MFMRKLEGAERARVVVRIGVAAAGRKQKWS